LPKLTARHADIIANKLGAERVQGRRHERVIVKWQNKLIGQFGIQRGSGDLSHNYIPKQILCTMRQALELAKCTMDGDEYFENLRVHGKLD
jgi:hypothetical protein